MLSKYHQTWSIIIGLFNRFEMLTAASPRGLEKWLLKFFTTPVNMFFGGFTFVYKEYSWIGFLLLGY